MDDSPMGLLLEAARRKDEIDEVKAAMPGPEYVFKRVATELPWHEVAPRPNEDEESDVSIGSWAPHSEDELQLARQVWYGLGHGMSYGQIVASFSNQEYSVQRMLYTLAKTLKAIA